MKENIINNLFTESSHKPGYPYTLMVSSLYPSQCTFSVLALVLCLVLLCSEMMMSGTMEGRPGIKDPKPLTLAKSGAHYLLILGLG